MVAQSWLAPLPLQENFIIVLGVANPGPAAPVASSLRDHTYHPLRVARLVRETADASSFVLDVPDDLRATFAYEPGQFCTFRVAVGGQAYYRCYSMSSAPALDEDLQVTVKRVPDGVVSNWMNDALAAGAIVDVAPPAGVFRLTASEGDVVAFAAGSGITPVFSLVKTALATTTRQVRLLYANRDRDSVIFGKELDALEEAHPQQLTVVHHYDVDGGFVGPEAVASLLLGASDATCYVCGPGPFMDIAEQALLANKVDAARIHIERFTPAETADPSNAPPDGTRVTIELDGHTDVIDHRTGTTILHTARQMGMSPPFSCESGNCATCMGRLVEGTVEMRANNALTPEEVDEGWVLTCQSVPTSPTVHIVYGYD